MTSPASSILGTSPTCEPWLGIFKGASQALPWPCVSKEPGPGQSEALAQDLGLEQNDVKMRGRENSL